MTIKRKWAMPNGNTIEIKPIKEFIHRYNSEGLQSADPFANTNRFTKFSNDLDPQMGTEYCMDAIDFLKMFEENSLDLILFDPPYSPRQVSECYKKLGKSVNMETTQASFWSNMKNQISRIVKPNGIVLCFGWNSQGIGKTRGFVMEEILLVAQGGTIMILYVLLSERLPTCLIALIKLFHMNMKKAVINRGAKEYERNGIFDCLVSCCK